MARDKMAAFEPAEFKQTDNIKIFVFLQFTQQIGAINYNASCMLRGKSVGIPVYQHGVFYEISMECKALLTLRSGILQQAIHSASNL